MNLFAKDKAKPKWWRRRTVLELCLLLICTGLLLSVITLAALLGRSNPPLEPAWGNIAEWAGVAVTFLGFTGAFGALLLQRKSVSIQIDQHMAARAKESAEIERRYQEGVAWLDQLHQQYASSLEIKIGAKHQARLSGMTRSSDGRLTLFVKVRGTDSNAHYTDMQLHVPDNETLVADISVIEADVLPTPGGAKALRWRAHKSEGALPSFEGNDADAQAEEWLRERVWVDFTDLNEVRWRKHADGRLEELEGSDEPSGS